MIKPCSNCPFRKDCLPGWLGEARVKEILAQKSFVCHKTTNGGRGPKQRQCAGHMLLKREQNEFYLFAQMVKDRFIFELSGEELVFDSEEDCINHHKNKYLGHE